MITFCVGLNVYIIFYILGRKTYENLYLFKYVTMNLKFNLVFWNFM